MIIGYAWGGFVIGLILSHRLGMRHNSKVTCGIIGAILGLVIAVTDL